MEKLLFKKIELWVVVLLLVAFSLSLVVFGAVLRSHMNGSDRFGAVGEATFEIASLPSTVRDVFREARHDRMSTIWGNLPRFEGQDGWVVRDVDAVNRLAGYVLLSRYDGVDRRHRVELVSLPDFEVVHEWPIDAEKILGSHALHPFHQQSTSVDNAIFRSIHPLVLSGGDLLVRDHYTGLARIDSCGNREWDIEGGFHHTMEEGPDGVIWVPGTRFPTEVDGAPSDFRDDTIVALNDQGRILFERSVPEILIENGLGHLLFSMQERYDADPLHLNDIQPVPDDGPYWKKGDVFLSMRHKSLVLLYRPATNEVLWQKSGPWRFQHDVDILDDKRISIYDNNVINNAAMPRVDGSNSVVVYNFEDGNLDEPFRAGFEAADIRTISEGLSDHIEGGGLLVEEENYGRLLILDGDGRVMAEYFNGDGGTNTYRMGWSRYISETDGKMLATAVDEQDCQ